MSTPTKIAPQGLSSAQAREQLHHLGPNEITATEASGWMLALRGVATEPMFVLLVAAAAVYLLIGDLGEGLLLSAFALMSVGLVVVQDRRSARALEALRALAAPQVRVLRDGQIVRIPSRELVPGDWLVVGEGDRLAADAVLRECTGLSVDESLLTGESVPVAKRVATADDATQGSHAEPGGSDLPWVFAGTLVVGGHGMAEVTATGPHTRAGAIGMSLASISQVATPLQVNLRRLVTWLGLGAVALSAVLVLWYGLTRGEWIEGLLAGIAAAMGMLPEEFPMALSVFLALGAWRLARLKVLVRRPAVIEALGGATVLCVDKTGTLTENRMQLRTLVTAETQVELPPQGALDAGAQALLAQAWLASRGDGNEPMDRAIAARGKELLHGAPPHAGWQLLREYPLQTGLLAVTHAWRTADGEVHLATKGAPEAVASLCQLDAPALASMLQQVQALASQGLRVLGVAQARGLAGEAPDDLRQLRFEWLGLAAFEDPLRPSAAQAVAQARGAGIAVVMITGDHVHTARAIARQAGIDTSGGASTGQELALLDDAQLQAVVTRTRVFARIQPEQKLRLVQALRASGEVVAMTGDGVNDAPALKAAHIGIAMGVRGTDVAREASAVVLLDEDFGHIVSGIRMGRRIADNLRKVMTYITAIHVPIAGVAVLPLLLGWPPMLLPAHVVLMEMIIDPVCALAFEGAPESPRLMQQRPRRADHPLIGAAMLWRGALQGLCVLVAVLGVYGLTVQQHSAEFARGLALVTLTVGNLGLVWLNASLGVSWGAVFGKGYRVFWLVGVAASGALAASFMMPGLRELLGLAMPSAQGLLEAIALGLGSIAVAALLSVAADSRRQEKTA